MATRKILEINSVVVVGSFASDPTGMPNGAMYYNSTAGKVKKLEGGTWTELASTIVRDDTFRISDDTDATKLIAFQASGINTGTTRTVVMPDSDVDLGLVASAIQSSEKGAANGVATLDSSGLIPSAQIPPIAITTPFVVADQAARLALTAQIGDVAIQTDNGITYILSTNSPSTNADWIQITAAGAVTSVNGETGTVVLVTDDLGEGSTNLYFTVSRARAAAVVNSLAGTQTDQAPSVQSVVTALAGKLSSVSQDSAPSLGGDLNQNGKSQVGPMHRAAVASPSNWVEEEYLHAVILNGSSSNAVASALTHAFATYAAIEVSYLIKEATTGRTRKGTLVVTNDGGSNIGITDFGASTQDVDVSFDAQITGGNVEVTYTTANSNTKTMRADVKRFKVS